MSVGLTTPVTEHDPVRAALADPDVRARLLAAARTFLGGAGCGSLLQEAEDVVQTAGMRAWERRTDYDPVRDVVSWLVGFVLNVTRETRKKHDRGAARPPVRLDALTADLGRPVADAVADREFVTRLLARLTLDERAMVRLVYTERLSFARVAQRLGLSEGAARVRHFRLLGHLRELAGEVRS